jgi:hypothetical protein
MCQHVLFVLIKKSLVQNLRAHMWLIPNCAPYTLRPHLFTLGIYDSVEMELIGLIGKVYATSGVVYLRISGVLNVHSFTQW